MRRCDLVDFFGPVMKRAYKPGESVPDWEQYRQPGHRNTVEVDRCQVLTPSKRRKRAGRG